MSRSKLTPAQIAEIRRLAGTAGTRYTWTPKRLARSFGTSIAMVMRICRDVPRKQGYTGFGICVDSTSPWCPDD